MKKLIVSLVTVYLIFLPLLVTGQIPTSTKTQEITVKNRIEVPASIDKRITTEQISISVTTIKISDIGSINAWCSYSVKSEGPIIQHGVCVSKGTAPTINNVKFFSKGVNGPVFSAEITGLSPSMKWYVRAFAKNSSGTVYYGNELAFNTIPLNKH